MDREEAIKRIKSLNLNSKDMEALSTLVPEIVESEDEKIRKIISDILLIDSDEIRKILDANNVLMQDIDAWLKKQGELKSTQPIWKYKKDNTPLLRDSLILNKYGCVAKSPSGALVSDVWVLDYDELSKLPKEEYEKQGEKKPTDKVEPKFHEGDWVVQGHNILKIRCVGDEYYCYETVGGYVDDMLVSEIDSLYHLWTIQDAKDGDVLANDTIVLIVDHLGTFENRPIIYSWYFADSNKFYEMGTSEPDRWEVGGFHPATKEQRDLLFQKMREARYEWDAEKKELKKIEDEEYNGEDYGIDSLFHALKILEKTLGSVDGYQSDDGILEHKCAITAVKKLYEQNPDWSEEDERMYRGLHNLIYSTPYCDSRKELSDWLKSLRPQNKWKPSDEQLKSLQEVINAGHYTSYPYALETLYEQLKKIKE